VTVLEAYSASPLHAFSVAKVVFHIVQAYLLRILRPKSLWWP